MAIGDDFSIATNGDIRHTSGTTTYTVLEVHRWLQGLADDQEASGNDVVDITSFTPSDRSTDQIITLLDHSANSGPTYNIDDDAAQYIYGGSITQKGGDEVYSGLRVLGAVNNNLTQLYIIQDNALYTFTPDADAPYWGDQSGGGYNGNAAAGVLMEIMVKSRVNGADIDGQRIRVQARHWGDTYDFFNVTLGQGVSVAAIGTTPDAQNTTDHNDVYNYTHVTNSGTVPVDAQDETSYDNSPTSEGTFSGGTGHATSDVITLSDGSTVVVDNQTGGVVDQFTVNNFYSRGAASGATLTQVSTTGSGTGFSLTLDTDNVVIDADHPIGGFQTIDLNNGNGAQEYYSLWTYGADTSGDGLKGMWEYSKDLSGHGSIVIDAQDETSYDNSPTTEGTFSGGTGHATSDVITMSDGTQVTVDAHSTGTVTQFTINAANSTGSLKPGDTLTQSSTTGSGTGFTLTVDDDNLRTKKTIDSIDGEKFLGITHSMAYNNEATGPFEEREIIIWGTRIVYDTLAGGTFTVGNYVTIGSNGAAGRIMYDDGTDDITVALEDTSITLIDNDVITEYNPSTGATGVTAAIATTITDNDKSGGSGLLLALDDDGTTGNFYIQLLTGSAPVTTLQVRGLSSGATADINGAPTARTIPKIYLGSYTGTLIGAYGIGVDSGDLTASDTIEDLTGTTQTPPNNVTFSVTGLVSGEDRVLVAPRTGVVINTSQLTLNTTLSGAAEGSVVATASIPTDSPSSGTIRVVNDSGFHRYLEYTSYATATFTLNGTYAFNGTNETDAATAPKDVYVTYIDKLAASATESVTVVFSSARDLFVRVRDGGASPIKTFESTSAQLTSTGGSVGAIRTTDA